MNVSSDKTQEKMENSSETCNKKDELIEACETNLKTREYYQEKYQKLNEEEIKLHDDDGNPLFFNGVEVSKLSKSQLKKYRRMLKFEAVKKDKRAKERLKTKKRKHEAKLNNLDLGPTRKQLKRSRMANSSCKTSVVLDLSFDGLMIPKVIS